MREERPAARRRRPPEARHLRRRRDHQARRLAPDRGRTPGSAAVTSSGSDMFTVVSGLIVDFLLAEEPLRSALNVVDNGPYDVAIVGSGAGGLVRRVPRRRRRPLGGRAGGGWPRRSPSSTSTPPSAATRTSTAARARRTAISATPPRPHPCLAPLEQGPYHAIPIRPGTLGTCGGLGTDDDGRVLDRQNRSSRPVRGRQRLGRGVRRRLPRWGCDPGVRDHARPTPPGARPPAPDTPDARGRTAMSLFAVIYRYVDDAAALDEHRPRHRDHLRALYEAGHLVVSGPLAEGGGPGALLIFRADAAGAGRRMARRRPVQGARADRRARDPGLEPGLRGRPARPAARVVTGARRLSGDGLGAGRRSGSRTLVSDDGPARATRTRHPPNDDQPLRVAMKKVATALKGANVPFALSGATRRGPAAAPSRCTTSTSCSSPTTSRTPCRCSTPRGCGSSSRRRTGWSRSTTATRSST